MIRWIALQVRFRFLHFALASAIFCGMPPLLRIRYTPVVYPVVWVLALLLVPAAAVAADAAAPQDKIPDAYSSILQRGVLGGESGPAAGPVPAAASSPYRLIGTLQSGSFSGAVVDDGTGVQTFYRIGQKLPDGASIVKVMGDRVLIKQPDGTVGELIVTDDAKASSLSSTMNVTPPAAPPAPDAAVSDSGKKTVPRSHRRRQSAPEE